MAELGVRPLTDISSQRTRWLDHRWDIISKKEGGLRFSYVSNRKLQDMFPVLSVTDSLRHIKISFMGVAWTHAPSRIP